MRLNLSCNESLAEYATKIRLAKYFWNTDKNMKKFIY